VWYVASMLTSTVFFFVIGNSLWGSGIGRDVMAGYLISCVGIPGIFAAVGFCSEPRTVHPRLLEKAKRVPRILQPFVPGGFGSTYFVHLTITLALIVPLSVASALSSMNIFEDTFWLAAGIFIYLAFCCSLSKTVRAFWDSPRSRVITLLTLAGLMLLPLLSLLFEDYSRAPAIAWIDPFVAFAEYIDSPGRGSELLGRQIFLWFHVGGIVLLAAAQRVRLKSSADQLATNPA